MTLLSPPKSGENLADQISDSAAEIHIENLTKKFGDFTALNNFSINIQKGEFITFLGPSGSGKTTTLMLVAGFIFPTAGDIRIGDESIIPKPANKRNLGIVFQNYSLFPHMTITENIAFPLKMRKLDANDIKGQVKDALELVHLTEFGNRYPKQLSGGQQQRVALARALVFRPPILLMDEPLGALDKNLREAMQLEIKSIQERLNITTIYVTHDQAEALTMSDRIIVMNNGAVEQIGSPEDLYEFPANRFVAGFIGESNFLEGRVARSDSEAHYITSDQGDEFKVPKEKDLVVGSRACIAIRPEKLHFISVQLDFNSGFEELPGEWNSLDGVISAHIYIGDLDRYEVKILGDQILTVKYSNRTRTKDADVVFGRNQPIKIGWKWHEARIVD
jgi:putative spermidine/putrescine transport system ATP-binding protein